MKNILLLVFMGMFGFEAYAGLHMACTSSEGFDLIDPESNNYHALVIGGVTASCVATNGDRYTLSLKGGGVGIGGSLESFVISCPSVSKKRLDRKGFVHLGSVHASAAFVAGASTAIALNHRGGFCTAIGLDYGMTAAVKIGRMSIYKEM